MDQRAGPPTKLLDRVALIRSCNLGLIGINTLYNSLAASVMMHWGPYLHTSARAYQAERSALRRLTACPNYSVPHEVPLTVSEPKLVVTLDPSTVIPRA